MIIEPVYKDYSRIKDICKFFNKYFLDTQGCKKLFDLPWNSEEPCGYVMYNDNSQIIGFIGTIHAIRNLGTKEILTCSLSSWAMDESSRGKGLSLIRKFLKRKNIIYLDLTANTPSRKIFTSFKFISLEQYEYIFPIFFMIKQFKSIYFMDEVQSRQLKIAEKKIINDHNHSCVKFVQILYKKNYLLLGYKKVKRKRLPFIEILYVNDIDLLTINSNILKYIAYRENVLGSIIDARMINISPDKILLKQKIQHKIYKNNYENININTSQIDFLYTEKVLFC